MINTSMTLKEFFRGFDLPAYTEDSIPDKVDLPYITFPLTEPAWNEQGTFYCQVWYKKEHLSELLAKADQIVGAIQEGALFENDVGYVALYPATPLIQVFTDEDSQRAYISLMINSYHMLGN